MLRDSRDMSDSRDSIQLVMLSDIASRQRCCVFLGCAIGQVSKLACGHAMSNDFLQTKIALGSRYNDSNPPLCRSVLWLQQHAGTEEVLRSYCVPCFPATES